jgi:SPP1 gp7 family putative phage head morphogenesis protein
MATDFLIDAAARHAHWVEQYKNRQIKKLVKSLQVTERSILEAVGFNGLNSLKDVREAQDKVGIILIEGIDDLTKELTEELQAFGVAQAEFEAATIAKGVAEAVALSVPTEAQLWAAARSRPFAGKMLKDTFAEFSDTAKKLIKTQVKTAFFEGYTLDELVTSLAGSKGMGFRDGVFGNLERSLERTVRTSVSHMASVARDKVYNDNSDVVTGVQWVSTLDGRTSAICRSLDGQVFPVDSGQRPPAHPNCRSTTVPVIDKRFKIMDDDDAFRPAKGADGREEAKGTDTYGTWLKRQPASFQDDILGKDKGKLFRQGGLPMDKFVDNGKELSLSELKKKYPKAWEKSNL